MQLRVPKFSLKHTLDSGQFFRYDRVGDWYYCSERDRLFKVRQQGSTLFFEGTDEGHIKRLFGLDQDYEHIMAELSKDKTLLPALKKYPGLRVMQRDPWETLVSFQCSIMSNIKKIKLNMNLLAKEFGSELILDEVKSAVFPPPGSLNDVDRIRSCSTGFRARYIFGGNTMVTDRYFTNLRKKSYLDAQSALMEIPGVAEKVADCVCLFSLGKMEAFPVDVWIERIMEKAYFGGKKVKHDEMRMFAAKRWENLAGYAQQFLYHWERNL